MSPTLIEAVGPEILDPNPEQNYKYNFKPAISTAGLYENDALESRSRTVYHGAT